MVLWRVLTPGGGLTFRVLLQQKEEVAQLAVNLGIHRRVNLLPLLCSITLGFLDDLMLKMLYSLE